jgi:cobalt-zinc-cadmium efflux system protein
VSAGHSHAHTHASADGDRRWLGGALVVIVAFMLGEVTVGVVAGSLALLSDAAHMLTDAAAIALALWAIRLAARPAAGRMTYGWKRVEVLSAQANGLTLLLLAAVLADEAIGRLIHPTAVTGPLVLCTAVVGIVVNVAATWMLSRANRTSLNVEGAFQHILTDLFAFIATAVAGVIIVLTGFTRADAIATLIVVALMVKAGFALLVAATRIFLEAAPKEIDPSKVGQAMVDHDAVVEVHDLHIWEITSGSPALSAHVLVEPNRDCHAVRQDLVRLLTEQHRIGHSTLQVDHALTGLLQIGESPEVPHCEHAHGSTHRSPPRSARCQS